MFDHWEAVVSAIVVGGTAIIVKYNFVLKKDCEKSKKDCRCLLCKKIEDSTEKGAVQTDALHLGARDTVKLLAAINTEMAKMNAMLTGVSERFDQYISDKGAHQ
jgi:hypothetical protein